MYKICNFNNSLLLGNVALHNSIGGSSIKWLRLACPLTTQLAGYKCTSLISVNTGDDIDMRGESLNISLDFTTAIVTFCISAIVAFHLYFCRTH